MGRFVGAINAQAPSVTVPAAAKTLPGAKANCSLASFTAGRVAITQWPRRPDHDYAC